MRIDLLVAAVAAGLAAVYLVGISYIPKLSIGDPLGPRAFPIVIGIGMLVAAILLVLETRKAARSGASEDDGASLPPFNGRLVGVIVGLLAMIVCFEPVGYVISVGVFLLVSTNLLNRGHAIANTVFSLAFTLVTSYVFDNLLDVRLPAGLLGF